MKKSKTIISSVIIVAIVCSIGAFVFVAYQKNIENTKMYRDAHVEIAGEMIVLDVVQTSSDRARGLGGRVELCQQCGMWFVFDEVAKHSFWMKDMQFDIDIIWINDTHVVHIEENVSHATPEKTYIPKVSANHVLELPAGRAQDLGITVGTTINPEMY